MLKIALSAGCALMSVGTATAGDTVTWQEDVEGWSVAIDRTIDDSCFIISGFDDETFLRFQFNATLGNVQFIVASIHWASLIAGEDYDMEVSFGGRDAWTGTAKGHRWRDILPSLVLSVPISDQQASQFMEEFTATGSVSISYEGVEIANLALTGTEEAIASMLDCQSAMSKAKSSQRLGSDPFARKPGRI